jgi:ribonuclease Y
MVMLAFGLLPGLVCGGFLGHWISRQQARRSSSQDLNISQQQAQRILEQAHADAASILSDTQARAASTLEETEATAQRQRADLDAQRQRARADLDAQHQRARSDLDAQLQRDRSEFDAQLQSQLQSHIQSTTSDLNKKYDARIASFQAEIESENVRLRKKEELLEKRDETVSKRIETLDRREVDLKQLEADIKQTEFEVKKLNKTLKARIKKAEEMEGELQNRILEIANLTPEQARQIIIDEMTSEARLEGAKRIKMIEDEANDEAEKRAKRIIGIAIQRYAGEYVTERCVTTLVLPSDEMKGRIIGREGRNIRAIEAATGVDLIVDDTPEAVVISGFDPVRREVARISLERLITDGRIHPSRIEEIVAKVTREVDQMIKESGDQAAFELGLHGLHPEILRLIGRLRYRTSYGQNMWSHSIEVGWLCGLMASELGLNIKTARRCGLLHDIGKAIDHELEGSHAILGAEFCKKHGEKPLIINAIAAHHNEVPQESVYAHLVMAADALSGARPGARREILETYIRRLEDLERISLGFEGVEKCHALQAGREIRVMVNHSRIDDASAVLLSRDIARKIEQELSYPGQIKVTVIRETRATEFAK